MTESSSSGLKRALESIGKCDRQANYREWSEKICQAISLFARELRIVFEVPCLADTGLITAAADAWETADKRLYSVLYFATTGSAHITVKAHKGKTKSSTEDGAAAWKALQNRFNGNTNEARRALREQLHKSKIKIGNDPTSFIATTNDLRFRLEDMEEEISDESYPYLLLEALTPQFQFVKDNSNVPSTTICSRGLPQTT